MTPKIAAPVQKFLVNRGDHVTQGQLLAILENRDLIAAAAEAKAPSIRLNLLFAPPGSHSPGKRRQSANRCGLRPPGGGSGQEGAR